MRKVRTTESAENIPEDMDIEVDVHPSVQNFLREHLKNDRHVKTSQT